MKNSSYQNVTWEIVLATIHIPCHRLWRAGELPEAKAEAHGETGPEDVLNKLRAPPQAAGVSGVRYISLSLLFISSGLNSYEDRSRFIVKVASPAAL